MNISILLLIIAIVLFLIAACLAFGWISGGPAVIGLVSIGLASFAAAHLPI